MDIGQLFQTIFVHPISNLLIIFYKLFLFIGVPGAFGLGIIALTIFVRLLLHPFFKQQMETAKKMQDLKPHLDKIKTKHKKDGKRLQQEQMKLYKEFGINPASGCLFMIIQMPIFFGLYTTLSQLLKNGTGAETISKINEIVYSPFLRVQSIDTWFLGFNLAVTPSTAKVWYYFLIPLLTAGLQFIQASYSTPKINKNDNENKKGKEQDKKDDKGGDFQKAMGTQMKYIFPIMIGWFSYSLPVGLSLYWNIFSIFSIIQYRKINKKKN